jgi:hypothetical protein
MPYRRSTPAGRVRERQQARGALNNPFFELPAPDPEPDPAPAPARKPAITIEVIRSTPTKWGYCRACHARIEWVETVRGRRMPIDWPLIALDVREGDGRTLTRIDAAQSHFVTCPAAEEFRQR